MELINFRPTRIVFTVAFILLLALAKAREHHKRIIGGKRAHLGEFPFLVSVADKDGSHFCGASFINDQNLLTAAHCFYNDLGKLEDPGIISLTAGELNVVQRKSKFLQKLDIYAYVLHPGYDTMMKRNDIALIRTLQHAKHSQAVSSIKYAITRPKPGTRCTVVGWGLTNSSAEEANPFLLKVEIPVVNFEECERIELGETQQDSQICAGELKGGKDSCRGDSGGPLICSGDLAGIVSYGHDCGRPGLAAIYTDVSHYTRWIEDMVRWDGNSTLPRMRKISASALNRILNGCSSIFRPSFALNLLFSILLGCI